MYAARVVESAPTARLYGSPEMPYTLGLLASIPRMDRERSDRLDPIRGNPPSPLRHPSGCVFHPRCKYTDRVPGDACSTVRPELLESEPDHLVRCHIKPEERREIAAKVLEEQLDQAPIALAGVGAATEAVGTESAVSPGTPVSGAELRMTATTGATETSRSEADRPADPDRHRPAEALPGQGPRSAGSSRARSARSRRSTASASPSTRARRSAWSARAAAASRPPGGPSCGSSPRRMARSRSTARTSRSCRGRRSSRSGGRRRSSSRTRTTP